MVPGDALRSDLPNATCPETSQRLLCISTGPRTRAPIVSTSYPFVNAINTSSFKGMLMFATGFLTSILGSGVMAQDASNSMTAPQPGVTPTGDYSGKYRPQVHFSPPTGFMNDPNGMFVDEEGIWHLYYQYNPTALVAGNQHWGHATSPDLYNWTNQPIAIYPPTEGTGVFSGSAVIDTNNTSGFFPNQTNGVVAVYTLNEPDNQTQNLAFSYDNGYTFEPYENNPVLDIGSNQFRDPKVIWYEDHWVMVIAYSTEFVIGIFTSPDLIEWTHASNVSHVGLLGVQYECPNMVPVPVRGVEGEDELYVLTISLNPGAPLGGSVTEWFPGRFNGTHFTPLDPAARLANFAKDNYAGQFFYGTPSEKYPDPISIAWASNWQYTNIVPTAKEGWRSAMTLAKDTHLTKVERLGWALVQTPHDLSPILDREIASSDNFTNTSISANIGYDDVPSNAVYFQVNLTIPEGTTYTSDAVVNFTFSSSEDQTERLTGGYYLQDAGAPFTIFVDRGKLQGFESPLFTDKFSLSQAKAAYQINGLFDRSLLEVWLDDGAFEGTVNVYPKNVLDRFELGVAGGIPEGVEITAKVWALKSTWKQ